MTRRVRSRFGSEELEGICVRRIAIPGHGRIAKGVDLFLSWIWLLRRRRSISAVGVMMDADFGIASRVAGLGGRTVLTWVTRGDATRLLSGRIGQLRRRLLAGCRHVVLTPRMRAELDWLGVPGATVIPVPVDTSRFRMPSPMEKQRARSRLGLPDSPVVLFVGHLQKRKGVDLLLRAFRLVLDSGQDAHLLIVGGPVEPFDKGYVRELEEFVDGAQLGDRVHFCGPQDDVVPFMFAADVFCLSSHREGMPNVLLEAMACGLTCVAPSSAGGDELLSGGAGIVPPTNSPEDLAQALLAQLGSGDALAGVGDVAASRVRRDNRPDEVAFQYERLWTS